MAPRVDPHAVLGVRPGADQAEIHKAYRAAVRRTHPDAGGTAAEFEAVQDAYEILRDGSGGRAAVSGRPRPAAGREARRDAKPQAGPDARNRSASDAGSDEQATSARRMDALLAESRRLEDEARRMAGLPPRRRDPVVPAADGTDGAGTDSVGAILRDATQQFRDFAAAGSRELRRRVRDML